MSAHKIQCPICSQEFPLYDQRGFRNAGFTAHHNWCIGRQQQQQNKSHQQDQQSTRASRFAMAIRRRLLPASQAHALANEGQSRITPIPVFPGSSSTSVNSDPSSSSRTEPSTPPFDSSSPALHLQSPLLQRQHFQQHQHHHQHHPILRQRHTWNHWNTRRALRRRTSANAIPTSSEIVPSASAPTPPTFQSHQMGSATRAMDPDTNASSTYSLLETSAAVDSTASTWVVPQTILPLLSCPPSSSSPMVINNSPFSFASMITTLPLEYSRNTINHVNSSYIDSSGTQSSPMFPADHYAPTDPISGYLPSDHNASVQQHPYEYRPQPVYQQQQNDGYHYHHMPPFASNDLTLSQTPDSFFHQQQQQQQQQGDELNTAPVSATTAIFMDMPATSTSPSASTAAIPPPSDLNNYQPNVLYCEYCQPREGLHDPSCSLLQFFLANIMDGTGNPFSST